MDPDETVDVLAEAIASPTVQRFVACGVVDEVVADARRRLLSFADDRLEASESLLASWREQLAELAEVSPATKAGWLGVAGTALAISAVAESAGERAADSASDDVLAGAVLSHAIGLLSRQANLAPLLADPGLELEAHRARVGELVWAVEAAIATDRAEDGGWLRLELEAAAALAAAAAAVVAEAQDAGGERPRRV
jgi:hypothetical protein